MIAAVGFLPALIAFPLAMASAMTLVALTMRLPKKIAALNLSPLPGPEPDGVKFYLKKLGDGFKVVARTPKLLFSLLAYSFVYAPTSIVYWLFAPAIALRLAGDPAHAVAYAGMMTGLYSLGGIIGSVFVMRQQRKEHGEAAMRISMLRWTAMTAAALLFFLAPALPAGAVNDATAVLEGSASIVIALGLWWTGKLLAGAHVMSALWLGAAIAPLIAGLLVFTWALARASRS